MLLGQHVSSVDTKSRIAFPKKFREILGDHLIITQGYENSLIIVSNKEWKNLLKGFENRSFIQSEARQTYRFLLGGASFTQLDSKGRFLLPAYLRTFAKVKNEVIFLGLSSYVELWDKEVWDTYKIGLEKNITDISQTLIESIKKGSGNE